MKALDFAKGNKEAKKGPPSLGYQKNEDQNWPVMAVIEIQSNRNWIGCKLVRPAFHKELYKE